MKKIMKCILGLMMAFAITGCSQNNSSDETKQEKTNENNSTSLPEGTETGNVLIAYFSWSGNTESLANTIHENVGGDLYAITTVTPYTDDYDELLDVAQDEQRDNARPEIQNYIDNFDQYDTIFIGYPNWWSDTPMAILTFLEEYDFNGKTVIPFCTHGSGGFGNSISSITDSAKGANILDGFEISGSSVDEASDEVVDWIDSLGLNK